MFNIHGCIEIFHDNGFRALFHNTALLFLKYGDNDSGLLKNFYFYVLYTLKNFYFLLAKNFQIGKYKKL